MNLRVIVLPVHLLAISLAVFRLGHRYRTKQYYWDDLLAACALTSDVGLFLSVWVWPLNPAPGSYVDPENLTVRIWVAGILLPCVIWSSRIAVAFSIYRIAKQDVMRKRCVAALIWVFLLIWMIIMVLQCTSCSAEKKLGLYRALPSCTGYLEQLLFTILSIVGDAFLVFIPLHMLRGLRLSKTDRFLVRTVFSVSVLSSIAAIVRTVCNSLYYSPNQFRSMFMAEMVFQVRGAVALIVCSLYVVIPCIYRLFRKAEQDVSIPISIHIDVSLARTSPARTPIADHLIPPRSQVEQAIVRERRSQGRVVIQVPSRASYDLDRPLSEPQPLLDAMLHKHGGHP